jgi:Ca2+-binding EF-hand superfamily protein
MLVGLQVLESKYAELFLDKAQKVFDTIDEDQSGTVSGAEIARILRQKLPEKGVEVRCS